MSADNVATVSPILIDSPRRGGARRLTGTSWTGNSLARDWHIQGRAAMLRNRRVCTMIALALASSVVGGGSFLGEAHAADPPATDRAGSEGPPSGAGAAEQNRSGGQFSPGGVPTKNQATTQPSVPPNGIGAKQTSKPGGNFGPGGAPTTGQAATDPARHGAGEGAASSDQPSRR